MRTFSEIIDTVLSSSGKPNYLAYAVTQANGIIQDLHTNHSSDYDLRELCLTEGCQEGTSFKRQGPTKAIWNLPCDFRSIRSVKYDGCHFVKNRKPGIIQKDGNKYWYQSGDHIVFVGNPVCDIRIAYYAQPRSFLYYDLKSRLIKSHEECGWVVRENRQEEQWYKYNANVDWHKAIWDKQVDWVIRQHYSVITDGILSSIYHQMGDTERGNKMFNLYTSGKAVIFRSRKENLASQV